MSSYGKRTRHHFRGLAVFAIVLVLVIVIAFVWMQSRQSATVPEDAIYLYFVDVGQADASFILTDEGSVLIDAGTSDSAPTLYHTINTGGDTLSYLIITHPHDDHMGGALYILDKMDVQNIILPMDTAKTAVYKKFLGAVEAEGAEVFYADADFTFVLDEITFTFLAPLSDIGDTNENSSVIRMDYGGFSALFTGDAEKKSEKLQLEAYGNFPYGKLDVDVLKVGHHGSSSSSTAAYLKAVTPEYAVISCGAGNSYGHPTKAVLDRLEEADAEVWRTDLSGTIVFTIAGETVTVAGG